MARLRVPWPDWPSGSANVRPEIVFPDVLEIWCVGIEVDECCTMICRMIRSKVKVKVTRPWKLKNRPFSKCTSSHFQFALANDCQLLNQRTTSKFVPARFVISGVVFVSRDWISLVTQGCVRQKSSAHSNEIRCVGRDRSVMQDGMPYDPIQDQGKSYETLKVRKLAIFKLYIIHHHHHHLFAQKQSKKCSKVYNWAGQQGKSTDSCPDITKLHRDYTTNKH